MTLANYLLRVFLMRVFVVMLILLFVVALLMFIESLRRAGRADQGLDFALRLTVLEVPAVMAQVFPLILMLGSLATFQALSRSSELVIIRAAGVSAIRFLVVPVIAAFFIGIIAVLVFNPIVAVTKEGASALREEASREGRNVFSLSEDRLWLRQGTRDGQTVIQANRASVDGRVLFSVRMHQFDPDNRLTGRIEANSATLTPELWILRGVRRWDLAGTADGSLGEAEQIVQLSVPTNLSTSQILDSFAQPETVSFWALPGFIRQLERAGFSGRRHRLFFQSELARPALFAAMVLIGAGFSLRHARFGQTGVMILLSIFAGFLLYFFKDLSESLGNSGDIPIHLAAWAPPMVAIFLALGLLLHLEDG